MVRIACFGASVTQQGGPGSYYFHLSKALQELGHTTASFGYGSMHIVNAGICFIDTVLEFKPDVCFLEWFTSGCYEVKDGLLDSWNAILYKFSKVNCKLILLVLPRPDWDAERERFATVSIAHMSQYGVQTINLSKAFSNLKELLRDSVHTNQLGAETYAKSIMAQYMTIADSLQVSNLVPQGEENKQPDKIDTCLALEKVQLQPNKYCAIKTVAFDQKIYKYLKFLLEGQIIGIFMNVGPFSSQLTIQSDHEDRTYNLWDEWCYYDRKLIKVAIKSDKKSEYCLTLNNNVIDRSKAKTQLDWDSIAKYFHPLKIFYLGAMQIIDYE